MERAVLEKVWDPLVVVQLKRVEQNRVLFTPYYRPQNTHLGTKRRHVDPRICVANLLKKTESHNFVLCPPPPNRTLPDSYPKVFFSCMAVVDSRETLKFASFSTRLDYTA
jgi:hypothetical protein